MRGKVYKNVGRLQPGRTWFDLTYTKTMTADMGYLYPIMCDSVIPGDLFKISSRTILRFLPLVAPILHQIDCTVHYFFVPYRILDDDWENIITGGEDGTDATPIPTWNPTNYAEGSLWDYLGFPAQVNPTGALPLVYPQYAYNEIYNEYYRDENLVTAVANTNESILKRAWEKDRFTSALTSQQKGTAPSLPISGTTNAVWTSSAVTQPYGAITTDVRANNLTSDNVFYTSNTTMQSNVIGALNNNTVDLSTASTFDIADLRLAFQIQKWMERNNRCGARYIEHLKAHYGVSPRDDRLDRPEYIGGVKSPVVISEVLQTSESNTTAQGTMAGHGLNVTDGFVGKYRVFEHGLIMGILSVMPKPSYQQGIDKQWLISTKYDFYFPEFANLSEQAIIRAELYANGVSGDNNTVFGYQGRYDEHRIKHDMVVGGMRSNAATPYDYWHLARNFASAPSLNQTFIECTPRKDIFAASSEPGLIIQHANIIQAFRPLPIIAEPGLIDHN